MIDVAQLSFIRRMYHRDQLSIEPRTVSRNEAAIGRDGVFLVSKDVVTAYMERYRTQLLRLDRLKSQPKADMPHVQETNARDSSVKRPIPVSPNR